MNGMVLSAIVLSVMAMCAAVYFYLHVTTLGNARERQETNIKIAATIAEAGLGGTQVRWAEDGSIERIITWARPGGFMNHNLVDSIARITGETATIFAYDETSADFERVTTSIVNEEGERVVGTMLGQDSAAYDSAINGQAYYGEATILGKPYYTVYQPLVDMNGELMGLLYVGVDKDAIYSVVQNTLLVLIGVGGVVLVVLGTLGFFTSRALTRPIPRLAGVMNTVAGGDFQVDVPYASRTNEIGEMARAVEVFRQNGLKVAEMTEAEAARIVEQEAERRRMMAELQQSFGAVVDAAIAGDFSRRVEANFADAELNALAGGVNDLVETVERGLGETVTVLGALAQTDLTRRVEGEYQGAFA
ncbi:Cache 3/Cache 2 fusion domain-containing protein, partial [Pelagibacterium xiamenense]|uniref:Cache 3/Cache 2 fusion domain-containing protein n=1 Tax=Pelagibacterium xiamenense TaxID=2901140 RepID=UPI001E34FC09